MNDNKKYNVFDFTLHEVTVESIRLCENERKKYNMNLEKVLESVINQMKTDETFKCLYRTKGYTGSSYENLKISKPNEFDINLIFVWPANSCKVLYDSNQPGYVKLKVNLDDPDLKKIREASPNLNKKLSKWIDKNGFFLRKEFRSWMQGLVDKALKAVSVEDTEIKSRTSGPAITLKVQQNSEQLMYSVDLVPAFLFTEKDWPKQKIRQLPPGLASKEWSVVPKEPTSENEPVYWRMTFYSQEKELMNGRGTVKHVIKLIKLLRDKENWSNDLYSYAIKTVFLWECEKLDSNDFWKKGIGFLFVHMLRKLSDYLEKGEIQYYWDPKLNLIGKMKKIPRSNVKDRINAILKTIDSSIENPNAIKACFGCVSENKQQYSSEVDCNSNMSLIDLDVEHEADCSSHTNLFAVSHHSQNLSKDETKPEIEKVNVDVHCTVEYNNKNTNDTRVDVDSPSAIDLLRIILKEQQETKETLQSMLSQFNDLCKVVRDLQQENTHLREQIRGRPMESIFKTSTLSAGVFQDVNMTHWEHSSGNQNGNSDISKVSVIQQSSSSVPNVLDNQIPESGSNNDFQFSSLLPPDFGRFST